MTADQTTSEDFLTLEKLASEVQHLAGQVVLMHDIEMAALIGVGMTEDDLYYIGQPLKKSDKPVWYSAVGACCGLKPYLPEEHYERIEAIWKRADLLEPNFQMLVQFEGKEIQTYNAAVHNHQKWEIQKRRYEEALNRVRRENLKDQS